MHKKEYVRIYNSNFLCVFQIGFSSFLIIYSKSAEYDLDPLQLI
jgi:hypothetical protein